MISRRCITIFMVFWAVFSGFPKAEAAQSVCSQELQRGTASWYGPRFEGKLTKSEEVYDPEGYTAAHRKLPFGTMLKVVNNKNNRVVYVRVNDRGAFKSHAIDLSKGAARQLGMIHDGVAPVTIFKCGK